jgi:hypothetical protein
MERSFGWPQGEGYLVSYKPDCEDKYEEYENSIEFSTQTCNFCLGVMAACQDVPLSNLFAVEYLYIKIMSSIRASFWSQLELYHAFSWKYFQV